MTDLSQSTIPPAVLGLRKKVAAIFLPYATAQEKRLGWDEMHPARFVHYTSAAAALSIIRTKCLWMRNSMCMADYREVSLGFERLDKVFSIPAVVQGFIGALDACAPGIAQASLAALRNHSGRLQRDTYITCVSEHLAAEDETGRLSMWRSFAPDSARVALVFALPAFAPAAEALNILFSPAGYHRQDEVENEVRLITENIRANSAFLASVDRATVDAYAFGMLAAAVLSLKNPVFKEEREWRAVYMPRLHPSVLMKRDVEVINGLPQTVYKLPFGSPESSALSDLDFVRIFDRLIIGPTQYGWPMAEAFASALAEAGVVDPMRNIWLSNISLRT